MGRYAAERVHLVLPCLVWGGWHSHPCSHLTYVPTLWRLLCVTMPVLLLKHICCPWRRLACRASCPVLLAKAWANATHARDAQYVRASMLIKHARSPNLCIDRDCVRLSGDCNRLKEAAREVQIHHLIGSVIGTLYLRCALCVTMPVLAC